jgi:hypothetical protein
MTVTEWKLWQEFRKKKVRNALIAAVAASRDKELTHEMIEQALVDADPELKSATVDDDDFHVLVTEVYAEHVRTGAVDG